MEPRKEKDLKRENWANAKQKSELEESYLVAKESSPGTDLVISLVEKTRGEWPAGPLWVL